VPSSRCSTRGAMSLYSPGRWCSNTSGGSTTWSSTLTEDQVFQSHETSIRMRTCGLTVVSDTFPEPQRGRGAAAGVRGGGSGSRTGRSLLT
jgi:hypothetical protein